MRSIDIIRAEHRAIAAVLKGLVAVVDAIEAGRAEPGFELLDIMVFYMEAMPETLHHPKEDDYLYRLLKRRAPEGAAALEEIHAEHILSHELGRRLVSTLLAYRVLGAPALADFARTVRDYAALQWSHMNREERDMLPLAAARLGPDDWAEIDAAFLANETDPEGAERRHVFRELFRRLAALAPAPIGLGG